MPEQKNLQSEFMGKDPVPRLLLRFAVPAIISTTVNCLYNIVDRLYLGHSIGPNAQAGLSLTFPYMIVLMAFGMLVGQGSGATVSLLLGQGRKKDADKVLGQAIALFLIFVISFQVFGLVYLDEILEFLGGTPQAIPFARSYMSIILWGSIFQHMSFGLSNVVRSEGCSKEAMGVIILGAVTNIILDPIFIFGLKMGIAGAALATVISMFVSSMWVLFHFITQRGTLKLRLSYIRIYPALFVKVISIGLAPCLMQLVHSAVVFAFNKSFRAYAPDDAYSTLAIGSYGIVNSIIMCLLMPAFGIMQGAQPIIGYNYGAKLYRRVIHASALALKLAFFISVGLSVFTLIFAHQLSNCFSKDEVLINMTAIVLRIYAVGFSFISLGMLTGNFFQSLGKAGTALFLSLTRQILFLLPILLLLPRLCGFNGIWWSQPLSDILSGLLAMLLYRIELRRMRTALQTAVA